MLEKPRLSFFVICLILFHFIVLLGSEEENIPLTKIEHKRVTEESHNHITNTTERYQNVVDVAQRLIIKI